MLDRRRTLAACAALAALVATPCLAVLDATSLRMLLLSAEDMNTPLVLLRADMTVEVEGHEGTHATRALALYAPGKDARWYLQVGEPAVQALVLGSERKVRQRMGGSTETVPIGAPIPKLGISYEDLSRFRVDDFKLWQISDEGLTTVTAGGYMDVESGYVYRSYSFDKERTIPLRGHFYADNTSNLARRRVDTEHVLIGKKWLPGRVAIQNFPEGSTTTLTVRWAQQADTPPNVLDADGFGDAATVPWASPVPTPVATPTAAATPAAPA